MNLIVCTIVGVRLFCTYIQQCVATSFNMFENTSYSLHDVVTYLWTHV